MGVYTTKPAQLPPRLAEISALIGEEETARLAASFGGRKVNFPFNGNCPVRQTLSPEAFRALQTFFDGEQIFIPLGAAYYRQQRISLLLKDGLSPKEIANQLGLTTRAIEHIRQLLTNNDPKLYTQSCA
jgi:DNA-binding NarL/FixJ family response regulator